MERFPDKINMDDLFNKEREQYLQREKVYSKILNRVHTQIKTTSRQRDSNKFVFFVVPEFLVGTPTYDVAACTAFIIDKLKNNGFFVKYTHPNLLFISWEHYLDKMKRSEIKKHYGCSVDGFGNQINSKEETHSSPKNMDTLLLTSKKIDLVAKNKKEYRDTNTYKPTGNLIYNNSLLQQIEDKNRII